MQLSRERVQSPLEVLYARKYSTVLHDVQSRDVNYVLHFVVDLHMLVIVHQCTIPQRRGIPFSPKRYTFHVLTLKCALQTLREHNYSSWVLYVDPIKAYDTINREMMFLILAKYGIPTNTINVIKKLYNDITINFNFEKQKSTFGSTTGVKQGDNLAPLLFILVIQAVSDNIQSNWTFEIPQFKWHPFPKRKTSSIRGRLTNSSIRSLGKPFQYNQSFLC